MDPCKHQLNFTRKPSDNLKKCLICSSVAKDPKQHVKCGKIFCSNCIEQYGDKPCPSCREESPTYVTDVRSVQRIQNLHVKCVNFENGCRWCGSVQALDRHVTCCDYENIPCKYQCIGCDVKMMRKDISMHEEEDNKKHFYLTLQEMAIPVLSEGESLVFKMTEYTYRNQNKEIFYLNPFYTHHNGYKIRIRVHVNGIGSGKGSHLSFFILFLNSPFDSNLQWPFMGTIFFEIMNQVGDHNHFKKCYCGGQFAQPGGFHDVEKFISHSSLAEPVADKVQFIKEDTIYFRVAVSVAESLPWLTCGKRIHPRLANLCEVILSGDPAVFKIPGYEETKRMNIRFIQAFFSHRGGYKMRASIHANGCDEGLGTHLSVFISILEGPYDGSLSWPFVGKVKLELLNQLSNTNHHCRILEFEQRDNINPGLSVGYPKFLSLSDLHTNNKQFLKNDTLFLRLTMLMDSHKSWLTL